MKALPLINAPSDQMHLPSTSICQKMCRRLSLNATPLSKACKTQVCVLSAL